jgi:dimethylhistidine N-methyltransferase
VAVFLVLLMSLKSIQKEREYTKFVVDERLCYYESSKNKSEKTFVEELSLSLNQKHKSIDPKFFYDKKGSKLFEDICKLPEYYLTRTEISILTQLQDKLPTYMNEEFRLVELGSGSSYKTRILISILENMHKQIEYFPIDISKILKESAVTLLDDYENLRMTGIIDTYESGLDFVKNYDNKKNLIVFLGSSFGNFDYKPGLRFLDKINSSMKDDDLFLIGLDLVKDKDVLEYAYNDSHGITAQFNLNVLSRINSELDSNFNVDKFAHHAVYNEAENRVEIYLRSLENQTVNITKAGIALKIKQNELIHTENSYKYTIPKIKEMFSSTGFRIRDMWFDEKHYFCLILLSKNS